MAKFEDFTEIARGNGTPCHGDLFEGIYEGDTYRAEFFIDGNFGHPMVEMAADSLLEKLVDGEWIEQKFPETEAGDDLFNAILSAITPTLE